MEGLTDDHICNRCGPYYTTGVKPEFHYRNNKSIVINKQTVMQIVIPATLTNGLSAPWFLHQLVSYERLRARVKVNSIFDLFKAFVSSRPVVKSVFFLIKVLFHLACLYA